MRLCTYCYTLHASQAILPELPDMYTFSLLTLSNTANSQGLIHHSMHMVRVPLEQH